MYKIFMYFYGYVICIAEATQKPIIHVEVTTSPTTKPTVPDTTPEPKRTTPAVTKNENNIVSIQILESSLSIQFCTYYTYYSARNTIVLALPFHVFFLQKL